MSNRFIKPIRIKNLDISNNVWLAPLAGGSNLSFRAICHDLGSGLVTTELVSARGIAYGGVDKSFRYLEICKDEKPVCIQLFGFDPEDFKRAIHLILSDERLSHVDMFDINMGCPVPKVIKTGAGSALMKTPKLARDIVISSKEALSGTSIPLSVKIRQGFDIDEVLAPNFAVEMADVGADLITVHARTQAQMYSGKADWSVIRDVVDKIGGHIPVFGNGDVVDVDTARQMFLETNCDGLMVGRKALGNPWIFDEINTELNGQTWIAPSLDEKIEVIQRHFTGLCDQVGIEIGAREMRKALAEYVKHQNGAASLRRAAVKVSDLESFSKFIHLLKDSNNHIKD